jgi:arylsulfatase A-like enzyme
MERREFLKVGAMATAVAASNSLSKAQTASVERPNVIIFISDQRTYGLTKATGFPLDTSPTLDRLQRNGMGFEHNYCTMPLCVPSRTTMVTGRWANAHRVRTNLMAKDAVRTTPI